MTIIIKIKKIITKKTNLVCLKLSLDQVTGLEDNEKIYMYVCLRVKSDISI